jgi:hypothetical protein
MENVKRYEKAAVEAMEKAQQQQEKQFNKGRAPTKTLEEGSQCLLSRDGIEHAISSKYIHPFIGPFKVQEAMDNDNYKLDLPSTMRIHPIFHISKLRPYISSYVPQQRDGIRPDAIIIDGEEQFEVDGIVRHRFRKGKKQYWVKWTGYAMSDNTWENADEMLKTARDCVEEYERRQ